MRKNWNITFYDKKDNEIETFIIEDRTEHEAENEVMSEVEKRSDIEDWTMIEV